MNCVSSRIVEDWTSQFELAVNERYALTQTRYMDIVNQEPIRTEWTIRLPCCKFNVLIQEYKHATAYKFCT